MGELVNVILTALRDASVIALGICIAFWTLKDYHK